jgi:hypothetical protein
LETRGTTAAGGDPCRPAFKRAGSVLAAGNGRPLITYIEDRAQLFCLFAHLTCSKRVIHCTWNGVRSMTHPALNTLGVKSWAYTIN